VGAEYPTAAECKAYAGNCCATAVSEINLLAVVPVLRTQFDDNPAYCALMLDEFAEVLVTGDYDQNAECQDLFSQNTCEGQGGKLDGVSLCDEIIDGGGGNGGGEMPACAYDCGEIDIEDCADFESYIKSGQCLDDCEVEIIQPFYDELDCDFSLDSLADVSTSSGVPQLLTLLLPPYRMLPWKWK